MNQEQSDNRQAPRYEKDLTVKFDFLYNAATALKYQIEEEARQTYTGVSKNISASGLCLSSPHELKRGQHLRLEVYLSNGRDPIRMDGEVRWCGRSSHDSQSMFDAGIRLMNVEGEPVDATVHLDEAHQVLWSNVLESVFGTFRKIVQDMRDHRP